MIESWNVSLLVLISIVAALTVLITGYSIYCVTCKTKQIIEDKLATGITLGCIVCHGINALLDPIGFYFYAISDKEGTDTTIYNG